MPTGFDDTAGEQLLAGRYRLHEQIGAGGMGVVLRATDTRLHRTVAVKRVRTAPGDNGSDRDGRVSPALRERALDEARIAARVHHPRIVSIFDVFEEAGVPWLVLEYLPSRSLAAVLDEDGTLPPEQVASVGAQVAEALAAAHGAGIVHGDVKPGNVLVTAGTPVGPVKLTDFGISHLLGGRAAAEPGTVVGTPAYLAPEVAAGRGPTPASDVYSLGATLFTAVQGAPPFGWARGDDAALVGRIAGGAVPRPSIGGPVAAVLRALTDADPAARPGAERAAELLRALAGTPSTGPVPVDPPSDVTSQETVGTDVPPARRRRRTLLAGMAAVAIAAIGLAGIVIATAPDRPAAVGPSGLPSAIGPLTIGDARTADPCSLLDPAALSAFGAANVSPDYGDLAECVVDLPRPGGGTLSTTVAFTPPSKDPPEGDQQRLGDALIVRRPAEGDGCRRYVQLVDGTPIDIYSSYYGPGTPDLDPCGVAETAVTAVANRLATAGIGRREPSTAPGSLWSAAACGVLEASDLASLTPVTRYRGFAGWKCDYGDGKDPETAVIVAFTRIGATDGKDAERVGVGYLERSADSCQVVVPRRPFLGATGAAMVEAVRIRVQGPLPSATRCAEATALATAAVSRL